MDVIVAPDAAKREEFARQEQREIADALKPKPIELEERKMGDLYLWVPPKAEKERSQTIKEKIAFDKQQTLIGQKAEVKSDSCWCDGCDKSPRIWVREVKFDIKDKGHENHANVTTDDYTGPVPGFCMAHTVSGPQELAEAVYFSRPEMYWGFRPKRWFVVFTDGTKQGGECLQINPKQESPKIVEEFIHGR